MAKLICDICGTSYLDTEEKCPTCGYSRAFEENPAEDGHAHPVREKVRGGRFSEKNVRKRRKRLEEAGAVNDAAAPIPVLLPEEAELPAEEIPEVSPAPQPEDGAEKERKKTLLASYRREVCLNLVLFFSMVVFLLSAAYVVVNHGIPYLRNFTWPTQTVTEPPTAEFTEALTDAPTDAPTDPPTEAPTDAPTQPPTEPPTDPPTQPPTEAPTDPPKPLLDVELTLNWYDLTFGAATQTTQLKAAGIPNADITWISDDPSVVTISDTGLITAVGPGKTTVRAIYGDQEVTVKINCRF